MAMKAAVRNIQEDKEQEYLKKQIAECPAREPRFTNRGFEYLCYVGIYDVKEIEDDLIEDYADWLLNWKHLKMDRKCVQLHQYSLKNWREFHKIKDYPILQDEIERCENVNTSLRNKVYKFLMKEDIHSLKEVDYDVRLRYENYLRKNVKDVGSYIKILDKVKVFDIRERNNGIHAGKARLRYQNQKIFLKYHPDYNVAAKFHQTRNLETILWDFSLSANEVMKRQIFKVLEYALEKIRSLDELRKGYLVPLQFFYRFCVEHNIEDIFLMEQDEVKAYQNKAREEEGGRYRIHQIVEKVMRILFLTSEEINWQANTWYMERFNFDITRYDPSRPVICISFLDIRIKENREIFKEYTKYLLGITSLVITTIVGVFYAVKEFFVYLDKKESYVLKLNALDMDSFFKHIDSTEQKPGTFNAKVAAVSGLFRFLVARGKYRKTPFYREYYLKKVPYQHNYRAVPENTVNQILKVIHLFPEKLRLMYLHLWCLGLRIGEVCTIKRYGYSLRDDTAWLRIYQHKMKMEKVIPIPTMLYKAMQVYMEAQGIKNDDYVFKKKNGPYTVGAFWHEMVDWCERFSIRCGDHVFQAHDYRHSVATLLYEHDVSLQAIRDFLGHKHEDMTRQYIDCIGKKLEQYGEAYFEEYESLAGEWKRGHVNEAE